MKTFLVEVWAGGMDKYEMPFVIECMAFNSCEASGLAKQILRYENGGLSDRKLFVGSVQEVKK